MVRDSTAFLLNSTIPVFRFEGKFVLWLHDRFIETPTDPRTDTRFSRLSLNSDLLVDPRKQRPVLTLFPTSWCNLACPYCYSGKKEKADLCFETASVAIDALSQRYKGCGDGLSVVFHGGGEPTQNFPLIKEVTEYLAEKGIPHSLAIVTNATAPPDQYEWLLNHDFVIGASIDGPPSVQDRQRPSRSTHPTSQQVESTLFRLRDHKKFGNINVRTTLTHESAGKITEIILYFRRLGIKNVFLETMELNEHTRRAGFRFHKPTTKEMNRATRAALILAERHGMRIGRGRFMTAAPRKTGCVAVTGRSFVVTPKNAIGACYECADDSSALGDIFKIGHVDMRKQAIVLHEEKIERLRQRNVENLPSCKECFAKFICAGGCAVRGIRETGDFFGVFHEECELIRGTIKQVMKLLWRESRSRFNATASVR